MKRLLLAVLLCAIPAWGMAAEPVHHELTVIIVPDNAKIRAEDRITLPEGFPKVDIVPLTLHGGLEITRATPGYGAQVPGGPLPGMGTQTIYEIGWPDDRTITVRYEGKLHHPPGLPLYDTPGLIAEEGALLSGATHWYPQFGDQLITFDLTVILPAGWDAVSQGQRLSRTEEKDRVRVRWKTFRPQDEMHLVAAPFEYFQLSGGPALAQAFLRTPDPERENPGLADRYMTATARYLSMYGKLIGPYPYPKFALVENWWETGFGMPSFTLLGPRVIRLPFILHTSFPHEILHNWWGNGVYVDYTGGNWSEGLTVYLADHLIKEQAGKGAAYRRDALQKYTDFVTTGRDFPLSSFQSKDGEVSEAVGYGKAMMLFHMLRVQLGDEVFREALGEFWKAYRFRRAGWPDIERVFSRVSGRTLAPVFNQWLTRTGAPGITVSDASAAPDGNGGWRLTFNVMQTQPDAAAAPYVLYLPVVVTLKGRETALRRVVKVNRARQTVNLTLPHQPVRLDADPDFDVFRRLSGAEIPPALSGLFGAEETLYVLPAAAPKERLAAYRGLAESWAEGDPGARIVTDASLDELPAGVAVWVLGWDNHHTPKVANLLAADGQVIITGDGALLPEGAHSRAEHAIVAAVRDDPRDAPLGWIASDNPLALPGLARKLPHYGKYGYLSFRGDAPDNVAKGSWQAKGSPLAIPVQTGGQVAALPKRAPQPERAPLTPGPLWPPEEPR
ncbi:MAG: M1 family metallopeptidase [Leptospirillia bacterium]